MIKKILSFLLVFAMLLSLCACGSKNGGNNTTSPNETVGSEEQSTTNTTNSTESNDATENTIDNKTETTTPPTTESTTPETTAPSETTRPTVNDKDDNKDENKDKNNNKTEDKPQETTPPKNDDPQEETEPSKDENTTITDRVVVKVEDVPLGEEDAGKVEIETPDIEEEVKVETKHSAIQLNSYYQYSSLSSSEKEVYNTLVNAIKNTTNVVNVQDKNISYNKGLSLLQKVLADNPQYFWVSKSTSILYNPQNNIVSSYILYYTDGKTTDTIDSDFNLTSTANRETINNQIVQLNSKIEEITNTIPVDATDIEKERLIHDYIVNTVTYDVSIASRVFEYGDTLPHAFDIYGAAIEGKAVCEGYAKLFQYLCYCTGINSTQILGTSEGSNHMWNAVKLDDEWYQIDVTWDDTNSATVPFYGFFNLTSDQMSVDHKSDSTNINVPNCRGTKYSVYNIIALNVTDLEKDADNIDIVVSNIIKNNMQYIIVSNKNISVTQTYLRNRILDANSAIKQCALSKGYKFTFELKYRTIGDFIYIPLTFATLPTE